MIPGFGAGEKDPGKIRCPCGAFSGNTGCRGQAGDCSVFSFGFFTASFLSRP